ncbi:hypothetical protein Tco_0667907 [Tanacetum coccineum]
MCFGSILSACVLKHPGRSQLVSGLSGSSYVLLCWAWAQMCIARIKPNKPAIRAIRHHPWFLKNMPKDLVEGEKTNYENANQDLSPQSVDEINRIIEDAKVPVEGSATLDGQPEVGGSMDADDEDFDLENDIDYSGICPYLRSFLLTGMCFKTVTKFV